MSSYGRRQNVDEQDVDSAKQRWAIVAPFMESDGYWIDDFGHRDDLAFTKIAIVKKPTSWHLRGPRTPLHDWLAHLKQSYLAIRMKPDGFITSFPQLALTTSFLLSVFFWRKAKLIAWTFNLGSLGSRWKGLATGFLLRKVDMFAVHSRAEIQYYSDWLGLPESRFRFVPLQKGDIPDFGKSDRPPYVLSMGSANRDYATLSRAVQPLDLPVIVVAKESELSHFAGIPNVTPMHGLTEEECLELLAFARINVVPLKDTQTASGQVSFINGMRMGVATIATDCVGSVDYIEDGRTGLLVPPNDAEAMREAILKLWHQDRAREEIANNAKTHAKNHFSDEAAARHLFEAIDDVCGKPR